MHGIYKHLKYFRSRDEFLCTNKEMTSQVCFKNIIIFCIYVENHVHLHHNSSSLFLLNDFRWTIKDMEITVRDLAYSSTCKNILASCVFVVCLE